MSNNKFKSPIQLVAKQPTGVPIPFAVPSVAPKAEYLGVSTPEEFEQVQDFMDSLLCNPARRAAFESAEAARLADPVCSTLSLPLAVWQWNDAIKFVRLSADCL